MENEDKTGFIRRVILHHYPQTQAIYLFGSFLTEDEWPDSDMDIAVLLPHDAVKRETAMMLSDCRNQLEEELKKEVDLVNLRQASTVFQF